jgi:diphosphomevalonate decarboxylase
MKATAVAHPNVALIKYWGKSDTAENIPAVGSLSLTLEGLSSRTSVSFEANLDGDSLLVNGRSDPVALARVTRCLDLLRKQAGVTMHAAVESVNDFPTGAGLASSASGYAALVAAAAGALGLPPASALLDEVARIGSGSAPRSLHNGIVLLDISGDKTTTSCRTVAEPEDWPLAVMVAVTSRAQKDVGSTGGMELSRATSPYYAAWLDSHPADLRAGLDAVGARDFERLAELAEHSCLKMHSVAMSTRPPLIYWSGATVEAMHCVRDLRKHGVAAFFTIDAGPQVKAVCLPDAVPKVRDALRSVPGVLEVLETRLGKGAWLEA